MLGWAPLMIRWILIKIVASVAALWVADWLLTGFVVSGGPAGYVVAGVLLGLLSAFVRPVLKVLTFPLILVTLGLFTAVINAFLLWLAADLSGFIIINGIWSLLWATVILSVVQTIISPKR
jgi:putative membrane protein